MFILQVNRKESLNSSDKVPVCQTEHCLTFKRTDEQEHVVARFFWSGGTLAAGERVVILAVVFSCVEEGAVHSCTHKHAARSHRGLVERPGTLMQIGLKQTLYLDNF